MRKWTNEQLEIAVVESTSIAQVLRALGLVPAGGNYSSIKSAISDLGLDDSHFTGQGWNKGRNFGPRRPIEDYLSNKFSIHSHALRLRLLREGIFQHKCYRCDNTEWFGQPIPLELEHINGTHEDNSLSNLTLLCPNCHAQTETYRGKNISRAGVLNGKATNLKNS